MLRLVGCLGADGGRSVCVVGWIGLALATGLEVGCVDRSAQFSIGWLTMLGVSLLVWSGGRASRCWLGEGRVGDRAWAGGRDAGAKLASLDPPAPQMCGPATLLALLYFSDQKFRNYP